ncbi:MAG: class D sortase [Patescibacteria group bacterium]|jgi:sortase A
MYTLPNQPQPNWFQPTMPPVRYRRRNWFIEVLKFLGLFIFFFAGLVLIVMGPTYYAKLAYLWTKPTNNYSQKYELPVSVTDDPAAIGDLTDQVSKSKSAFGQDTIVIPKINVDAPLLYLETTNNTDIIEAIQNGVGHYQGTALPGQNGNVFLTGHSSYYWWSGGKYNQVFALLNKLEAGDLIYLYYQGNKYIYRVSQSFVVKPEQVEVLQATTEPILTLMTCTPVGTNLKRLIVRADLISQPPVSGSDFSNLFNLPKPPTILPLY